METFRPWPATVIRSYYEHPPDRGQGIRALRAGASRNELSLSRGRSSHSCRCQRMCQDRLRAGGRGRVYRSSQFCFDIPVAPAPAASIRTCSCWVRSSGAWASTSGEDRQRSVLHLKDVYFISSRSAESPAATPAPHPAAEGGRAAVPLRVGAAVRALWGDG